MACILTTNFNKRFKANEMFIGECFITFEQFQKQTLEKLQSVHDDTNLIKYNTGQITSQCCLERALPKENATFSFSLNDCICSSTIQAPSKEFSLDSRDFIEIEF